VVSVALVSCRDLPDGTPDDRLLVDALREEAADVRVVCWDDSSVRWTDFDAVVVRSTWDYHLRATKFLRWIDELERSGAPLWNPAPLLRWNADKRYLTDLERRGVEVVPTELGPGHLREILERRGWERAVVKPRISAAAAGATVRTREDADDTLAEGQMVQPFMEEVRTTGEWSVVLFAGEPSHAVLKRPAAGDFRVQEEHGGTVAAEPMPPALAAQALEVAAAIEPPWLYARVDAVDVAGRLVVMEVELIEPELFFRFEPGSAVRMARAILERASSTRRR